MDAGNSAADDANMDADTEMTLLYRIDHARNMARFYSLSVEPSLFGGSALVRRWGRIGTNGRQKIEFFDTAAEAADVQSRFAAQKLRRGYVHERLRMGGG